MTPDRQRMPAAPAPPPRFHRPSGGAIFTGLALAALTLHGIHGTEMGTLSLADIVAMPSNIARLVGEMLPPSPKPFVKIGPAVVETLQMSLLGTVIGSLTHLESTQHE